jgi:hypothetical protein
VTGGRDREPPAGGDEGRRSRRGRWLLTGWLVAVVAVLGVATVQATRSESVFTGGARLLADPWGRATLVDCYGAFVAAWLAIAARERNAWRSAAWLLAVLLTGNFALCAWLLLALRRLPPGASWREIFVAPAAPAAQREDPSDRKGSR